MSFTLDAFREAAQKQFGDFVVDDGKYVLVNPIRLDSEKRAELSRHLKSLSEVDDTDVEQGAEDATLRVFDILKVVSKTAAMGRSLVAELKGDVPTAMVVLQEYQKAVGMGEASDSPN